MMPDWWKLRGRFGRDADLMEQAKAYRIAFGQPGAKLYVLPDLAEVCGVGRPLPTDPGALQRAAGRQDVWLHLQRYLNFTEEEVYAMLKGNPIVKQPVGDT
jgi:hypothetical protein